MSHYEERLQQDLDRIKSGIVSVADQVQTALERAIRTLLTQDRKLASETILGDLPINRETRAIDKHCHAFVARHLPAAGILRYVSSVMRLTVALERIGDYAVTICREAVALEQPPPPTVTRDIEMMADHARQTLSQAIKSFSEDNAELARGTMGMADQMSKSFDKMFSDLVREGQAGTRPIADMFALLVVLNRLERVSNQAKNICEETVFAVTGEQKAPKVYDIHFLDAGNDCWGPIAVAFARKAFPEAGVYSSSGWNPEPALRAGLAEFLDAHGLDSEGLGSRKLTASHDELASHHVIIALEPGALEHLPELPFHTVLLEWDLGGTGEAGAFEAGYKQLALEVRKLMEILHGEEN